MGAKISDDIKFPVITEPDETSYVAGIHDGANAKFPTSAIGGGVSVQGVFNNEQDARDRGELNVGQFYVTPEMVVAKRQLSGEGNMYVGNIAFEKDFKNATIGESNHVFGVLKITTVGSASPIIPEYFTCTVDTITGEFLLTNLKVYFTGNNPNFSEKQLLGQNNEPGEGNNTVFNGSEVESLPGTNYYWLVADIASFTGSAKVAIDIARINGANVTVADASQYPYNDAPVEVISSGGETSTVKEYRGELSFVPESNPTPIFVQSSFTNSESLQWLRNDIGVFRLTYPDDTVPFGDTVYAWNREGYFKGFGNTISGGTPVLNEYRWTLEYKYFGTYYVELKTYYLDGAGEWQPCDYYPIQLNIQITAQ